MKKIIVYFLLIVTIPMTSLGMNNVNRDSLIVLDYPNSLENLLGKFKGKVVYVDVLASWCTPCIEQFAHTKKMYDFFKKNNVPC